jgi:hypothetical protein
VTVFLFACSVYVTESRMTWIILLVMAHDDMMDKGTDIFKECLENTTRLLVDEA